MELKLGQDKKKLAEKKRQEDALMEELSDSMKNIDKRYFTVQKSFHKLDTSIEERDDSWEEEITNYTNQLEEIKKEMSELQERASESIALMKKTIIRFKNSSKKDEFDKVSKRLNDWELENFITKDRFKKILLQEIDKQV